MTYRNPALLAKAVTALDVISNGRALLGIGAAWYELEHESLGVGFPPLAERFERLEEALQICTGMFTQRQTTFAGKHYAVTDAWNSPAPVTPGGPPILVGGTGEQKTARLAARYAEEWNCNADVRGAAPQARRARRSPRRPRARPVRHHGVVPLARSSWARPTPRPPRSSRACCAPAASTTRPPIVEDAATRNQVLPRLFFGDPDEVVAQVQDLMAVGLDGIVVNMLGDGHDPAAVALAGATLRKALG